MAGKVIKCKISCEKNQEMGSALLAYMAEMFIVLPQILSSLSSYRSLLTSLLMRPCLMLYCMG